MSEGKVMISVAEVAEMLGLPTSSVYAMASRGDLPGKVIMAKRTIRFRRKAIEDFIARGGNRGDDAA